MSKPPERSPAVEKFLTGMSAPRPRSRLATFFATVLTVAIIGICALCGLGLYYFRPQLDEDPARVGVVEAQMLRINVPRAFEPRGTIEWDLASLVLMRGVYYELTGGDGMLMILQVDSRLMEEADVRDHVERTLREKGGGGPPLKITSEREFPAPGPDLHFIERVGESPVDSSKYHLVEGVVAGNTGEVLIAFRIADEAWDEKRELVEQTLASLR